jgi:hypothetical protein
MAGQEAGMIATSDEATPAWLTRVLRTSGAIGPAGTVDDVTCVQFAQGNGLLSELFRLTPSYGGAGTEGAPATLVLKLPTHDPAMRGVADALGFYRREARFYRELAADAPFRTARCHAAVEAEDGSTDFVILMEDLGPLHQLDQVQGCSWEEALGVVDSLTAFHAQWWQHERLPDLATTFLPVNNDMYVAVLPQLYEPGWAVVKEVAADLLTPELRAFGDRWSELCGSILAEVTEPMTLIHGDWRSDNLFVAGDDLWVIDFQIVGTGSGLSDLGYFVSQSIEPEVRHGRDREICDEYVKRLATRGIEVDRDEAWRLYRLALAFCLTYPVTVFQSWDELPERGHDLVRSMLRRSLAAIADSDALSVLPG